MKIEKPKTLRIAILHALDRAQNVGMSIASTSLLIESAINDYLYNKVIESKELGDSDFFDRLMKVFFDGA